MSKRNKEVSVHRELRIPLTLAERADRIVKKLKALHPGEGWSGNKLQIEALRYYLATIENQGAKK